MDVSATAREDAFREALDSEWAFLESSQRPQQQQQENRRDERRLPRGIAIGQETTSRQREIPDKDEEDKASAAAAGSLRSPFLVCTNRHPDSIRSVEEKVHRTRTRLAYSRGETACLLVGLCIADVDAVRGAAGVHLVEPLPHLAKFSKSLRAEFEPREEPTGSETVPDGSSTRSGSVAVTDKKKPVEVNQASSRERSRHNERPGARKEESATDGISDKLPRKIRFNHGEGLPGNLEITLTPGVWGFGMAEKWVKHMTSFGSTAKLWDQHLRQQLLWTRSDAVGEAVNASTTAAPRRTNIVAAHATIATTTTSGKSTFTNKMAAAHGLTEATDLWEQAAHHSSKGGACDFLRLHTQPVDEEQQQAHASNQATVSTEGRAGAGGSTDDVQPRGSNSAKQRGRRDDEAHDRVVLRGADALGNNEENNVHCLMTVMAYLATRAEVAYVDDLPRVVPLNIEAAWILQSGEETTYPVWEQNIDGHTEVNRIQ